MGECFEEESVQLAHHKRQKLLVCGLLLYTKVNVQLNKRFLEVENGKVDDMLP